MKIELTLTIRDGFWMLSSDDLPGLSLMGEPDTLMADFVPAWRKLHELCPNQVMPVPRSNGLYAKKKYAGEAGGKARAEKLTPERRKEIAKGAARARWKTA